MTSKEIEKYRETAEIYHGDDLCKQKSMELMEELSLPKGILPMDSNILEVGYNRSASFVWQIRKKKYQHFFQKIGRKTSYGTEVTAFVEKHRMKKLTGVKTKELLFWVPISEISIDDPASQNITFKATVGLSQTFPVSAFEIEEEEQELEEEEEKEEEKEEGK
ncbi:uncharacterized protein LOC131245564 [Magnolia sinica]|uniref:uncharacterized protein LOC131245564 n=1 Tax=Magnolia sinica TaxID=86752 RepID=UPI00265915ED|nr:uncharacterized protein LOC131245564 [Magnolia sinica]